jgi:uncharacterized phage protein (TIGR02218 family)
MKDISAGFQTDLEDETTNLARIWTLTLINTTVYRFTDSAQNITYSGDVYKSSPGMQISAIRTQTGGATQTATIDCALSSDGFTETMVRRGLVDNALFTVQLINWKIPSRPAVMLFKGRIGETLITDRGKASFEVRGLLKKALRGIGERYSQQCRADLGDERCKFPKDTMSVTFTVTSVAANGMSFISSTLTQADSYWDFGEVKWTTGNNTNITQEVRQSFSTGSIHHALPFPADVQIGDTGIIWPGCDKNISTCLNRFNNKDNFRGEPNAPGADGATVKV